MCFQEEETERYDINGMVIDMCRGCFAQLQEEVVSIEGLDKAYYQVVFAKLGIEPKNKCNMCSTFSCDTGYRIGHVWVCDECFATLNSIIV